MKTTLTLITAALAALAMAHPRAAFPQNNGVIAPRLNDNDTDIAPVQEPIPVFTLPCECPAAVCDPRLNAKSICECKASAAQACYIKSAGGCAMPEVDVST